MYRLMLLLMSVLWCCVVGVAAPPERGVFELAGEQASGALLTVGDEMPAGVAATVAGGSPMLLNLGGYVGSLTGPQVQLLSKSVRLGGREPVVDGGFRRVCVVHLLSGKGVEAKRVEVLTGPEGATVVRELGAADTKGIASAVYGRVFALDPEKYRQVSIGWARYRGPFVEGAAGLTDHASAPAITKSVDGVAEMAGPIVPAPLFMDERTYGDRFISGGRSNAPKVTRKLADEKYFVRLPPGLDPKKPAGLLVFINAAPDGRPPEVLFKAMDELGIVCAGAENAGNERAILDRFQLVIDTVFAVSERVHIDPRRVYVSGISGGGRCSTRLQCCFPDYFTGAVPIVGLSAYFDVPVGNGKHAPAGFDKPGTARFSLLRTRRIGVITGPADFNYGEIMTASKRMAEDKLQVRVFEHEMGHQLPTAEWFAEALRWVDGPYREQAAKEAADAQVVLDGYIKKWGEVPPPAGDARAREELVKVTRVGPWSAAAWRAVELLK